MSSINASKKVARPASLDAVEPQGVTQYDPANASRKVASPSSLKSNVTKWIPTPPPLPIRLGAILWVDASDATTITESGGAVSQWDDKSGNGNNLTQAAGLRQPATGATTVNGLNVIDFAGNDCFGTPDKTIWNFLHNGNSYNVFLVANPATSNPSSYHGLIASTSATAEVGFQLRYDGGVAVDSVRHTVSRGVSSTLPINNISASGDYPAGTWQILHVEGDPDNGTAADRSIMTVDNGTPIANNVDTYAPSTADASNDLTFGAINTGLGPGSFLYGSFAEIIIVDGTLTADQISDTETYLANKWGITI